MHENLAVAFHLPGSAAGQYRHNIRCAETTSLSACQLVLRSGDPGVTSVEIICKSLTVYIYLRKFRGLSNLDLSHAPGACASQAEISSQFLEDFPGCVYCTYVVPFQCSSSWNHATLPSLHDNPVYVLLISSSKDRRWKIVVWGFVVKY